MGEADTKKVIDFYARNGNKEVLEGKVELREGVLCFNPLLTTIESQVDSQLLHGLLEYLGHYQVSVEKGRAISPTGETAPVQRVALTFSPSLDFSLKYGTARLSLYLSEPKNWGRGDAIDIFDRERLDGKEFEEIVSLFTERKTSTFVLGRLTERKDYPPYTILRRYFPE